ncbi:MAG: nucleoside-diphosphate sugar epimerase [Rhodospirillales bacterium 69-11]|nr:NAD-dependent epimerase/dehydratase family protein [Rhodospirillales bacterium]OJW24065.1 MAG: nucleoside-diphosphate sugar epimerase [Rhodospirillales bacterium 69-11]
MKKVVVAGATGLVGFAALKQFAARAECEVIGLSRRQPHETHGATCLPLDLTDAAACRQVVGGLTGVTHLVYAALFEMPGLVAGWQAQQQIATNDQMLRNLLEPLLAASPDLRHVTLLQGTKAYGVHVRPMKVPAREGRSELRSQANFYWAQEDYLRARLADSDCGWTVLRPVLIVGEAIGGAMNLIPALGVHAALARETGRVLPYPGGADRVGQAVDADLLAEAIAWAGEAAAARNEVFNVTNGDVFVWRNVWPAIAEAVGMEAGEPAPFSLRTWLEPAGQAAWDGVRTRFGLVSPGLSAFVGQSMEYADYQMRHGHDEHGAPSIVSTIKLQQAGFHAVMDTEAMFRKWFEVFQRKRLLPSPG